MPMQRVPRIILLSLLFVSTVYAQTVANPYKNDREGSSFYDFRSVQKSIKSFDREYTQDELKSKLSDHIMQGKNKNTCAEYLYSLSDHFVKVDAPAVFHKLRQIDLIDDVILSELLYFDDNLSDDIRYYTSTNLPNTVDKTIIEFFDRTKTDCLRDNLQKFIKAQDGKSVKKLLKKNLDLGLSFEEYSLLMNSYKSFVSFTGISLSEYLKKKNLLRVQYPVDVTERSEYVTELYPKTSYSYRQKLLNQYSYIQIILMGNVVKKLKERLDATQVAILVTKSDGSQESIVLEPMERFRFALKILRKEMAELKLNSYFNGIQPSYFDILAAAYELGLVKADEIAALDSLEDIWNPKKTRWEKAWVWIRTVTMASAAFIPQPYTMIPALAIVIIEATTIKKDKPDQNLDHSLF